MPLAHPLSIGSVQLVTDDEGEVTLVQSYDPYGETIASMGEFSDESRLIHLRARARKLYAPERFLRMGYDPASGRFLTKDSWSGDYSNPVTLAKWLRCSWDTDYLLKVFFKKMQLSCFSRYANQLNQLSRMH